MCTFAYDDFQPLVWALVVTAALLALLFVVLGCASGRNQQWVLGIFALVGVGAALPIGFLIEDSVMKDFWVVDDGAEYKGVHAFAPSASYGDAALLEFVPGTVLDTHRSLGMMKLGKAYCVSPIIGPGFSSDMTPQFWAVGVDCCGMRGSFSCNDAGVSGARAGAAVADRDGSYAKAVRMALSVQELPPLTSEPVFLRWISEPATYKDGLWARALVGNVAASCIYFVCSVFAGLFAKRLLR